MNMCKRSKQFGSGDFIKNLGIMSVGAEDKLLAFLDKETSLGECFVEEMRRQYFLKGDSLRTISPAMGAILKGLIAQHFIREDLYYGRIRLFVNSYCYAYNCSVNEFYEEKVKGEYESFPVLTDRRAEKALKDAIKNHLKPDEYEAFIEHAKHKEKGVYDNGEEQRLVTSATENLVYFKEMVNLAIFERRQTA